MHYYMLFKQAEGRTSSTFKCIHCDIHISNLLIDQYKALHSYVVLFESIHRWFHQLIHIPDITYFVNSPFQLSGWSQELILKIETHFSLLQQETEKLCGHIDKMRSNLSQYLCTWTVYIINLIEHTQFNYSLCENRYGIDKVAAEQRPCQCQCS